jgi:hypothetical protein
VTIEFEDAAGKKIERGGKRPSAVIQTMIRFMTLPITARIKLYVLTPAR